MRSIEDAAVRNAFDPFPEDLRAELAQLRELILSTAAQTDGVGELVETTKWAQPAYLPSNSNIGSTIRIGTFKHDANRFAVFFHCQTTLVEDFRAMYPDEFRFGGNRALVFDKGQKLPADALKHCIAQALTYHLRKRQA